MQRYILFVEKSCIRGTAAMEEEKDKDLKSDDNVHGQENSVQETDGAEADGNVGRQSLGAPADVATGADLIAPLKGAEAHAERVRIRKLFRKQDVKNFFKANVVLIIAIIAAAATCFFVPFDAEYAGYFDWRTLSCLFCTLAVVAAFKNIRFFVWLADVIVRRFKNFRTVVVSLVFVTYFGSMIMANDMALVTFLPLGYFVLESCGGKRYMAFTFIMQNIAANLGGMLTPFGNPQNLYLYSFFNIGAGEFFTIMAIPFAAAFLLILGTCMFVKPEKVEVTTKKKPAPSAWRAAVYGVLFVVSVLIVFRIFPYYWGLLAVTVVLLALDFRAVLKVDYGLLLTFCAFFVFSGNMARIEPVQAFLGNLMEIDPLAFGVLSCQVISNVPSAVLLSRFTTDYARLLIAVNLGGLGTPIASLASLITLNTYRKLVPGDTKKYVLLFLALNFGFLLVLTGFGYLTCYTVV